jgi:hypothetical protein
MSSSVMCQNRISKVFVLTSIETIVIAMLEMVTYFLFISLFQAHNASDIERRI